MKRKEEYKKFDDYGFKPNMYFGIIFVITFFYLTIVLSWKLFWVFLICILSLDFSVIFGKVKEAN